MNLSDRLLTIANCVTPGNSLADIGTDHGYIPIYLVENAIVPYALAMDVAPGPLSRAIEGIARHGLEDKISTRLSDGLKELKCGETDTILIAGMGGLLMVRILSDDMEKAKCAKELILSPHSDIGEVRRFLYINGFRIGSEKIVFDEGKYYFVLKAVYTGEAYVDFDEEEIAFGRFLINEKNPTMLEYLQKEQTLNHRILENIQSNSTKNENRITEITDKIQLIERAIDKYEG